MTPNVPSWASCQAWALVHHRPSRDSSSGTLLASPATWFPVRSLLSLHMLFCKCLERGCQPPGLLSDGMWAPLFGSFSYFPGWCDSQTGHWERVLKDTKKHLHRMREGASALETWLMWFFCRARHSVQSQQRFIFGKKKKKKDTKYVRRTVWGTVAKWSILSYSKWS